MIGGISIWQLLILLLIVVLVFGTKRLRNIGSDLGSAVKGFRKGLEDEEDDPAKRERLSADEPEVDSVTRGEPSERKPGSDV